MGSRTARVLLYLAAAGVLAAFWATLAARDSDKAQEDDTASALFAGIPSDCSRPVDVELNRLIVAAADGSTLTLPAKKCFGIDGPLVVAGKSNFTLDGRGATVRALTPGGPQRATIDVRRGASVSLVDVVVEGAFPGKSQDGQPGSGPRDGDRTATQAGVALRSVRSPVLRDVRSANTGGECVMVGADGDGGPSSDVLVERLDCKHSGRHGVAVVDAERVVLRDARIADVHECGVNIATDLETQVARDVQVESVSFGITWSGAVCNVGEGTSPNVGNLWVVDNEMKAAPASCGGVVTMMTPPHLQASGRLRTGYRFIGNRLRTIGFGLIFSGLSGVELSGNSVERSRDRALACADVTRMPPQLPPAVSLTNVQGLHGRDNRWSGFDEIVRADSESRDVQPLS